MRRCALRRPFGRRNATPLTAERCAIGEALERTQLSGRGSSRAAPGDARLLLLAPLEVEETPAARAVVERLLASGGSIDRVEYADLRQSMPNGGGPACPRLRVVLTEAERAAVRPSLLLDADLYARLANWVDRHCRESLAPHELADPALLRESREALDELTTLLGLGGGYCAFQRG